MANGQWQGLVYSTKKRPQILRTRVSKLDKSRPSKINYANAIFVTLCYRLNRRFTTLSFLRRTKYIRILVESVMRVGFLIADRTIE